MKIKHFYSESIFKEESEAQSLFHMEIDLDWAYSSLASDMIQARIKKNKADKIAQQWQ